MINGKESVTEMFYTLYMLNGKELVTEMFHKYSNSLNRRLTWVQEFVLSCRFDCKISVVTNLNCHAGKAFVNTPVYRTTVSISKKTAFPEQASMPVEFVNLTT